MKKNSLINLVLLLPGWALCLFIFQVPVIIQGLIGLAVFFTVQKLLT